LIVVFKDLPWYYAELLEWKEENGIVKAYPKAPLSDVAYHTILGAFKRWGGKYVSWNGQHYFELVLEGARSVSTEAAEKVRRAFEELNGEKVVQNGK